MTREEIYNAAFHDELRKIAETVKNMQPGSNVLQMKKKVKTAMVGKEKKPVTVPTEV